MKVSKVEIEWPNGLSSFAKTGSDWLKVAKEAGIQIPTGCLGGSCGACEIEVNGQVIRACINCIPESKTGKLTVDFNYDPYW